MTKQLQSDQELRRAISEELSWTPSIDSDQLTVAVTDGAVMLAGQVTSYPQKQQAVKAALRVRGVTAIADEIVVSHPWGALSDTDIARDAGEALDNTVTLPPGAVKATVHDHAITLTGEVGWEYQRAAAQRAVSPLRGVCAVHNKITIHPAAAVEAAHAKSGIISALVRGAHVDAQRIDVEVSGSEVILTGVVSSWAERRQAAHAAWSTPGVTGVDNRLTVSG